MGVLHPNCICGPYECIKAYFIDTGDVLPASLIPFYCVCCSNKCETLPLATRLNIVCVGLSPDGSLAILIDEGTCTKGHLFRERIQ